MCVYQCVCVSVCVCECVLCVCVCEYEEGEVLGCQTVINCGEPDVSRTIHSVKREPSDRTVHGTSGPAPSVLCVRMVWLRHL